MNYNSYMKRNDVIKKKRVGIDCRMINESGIGRYISNIVTEISKKDSDIDFYLFFFNVDDSLKYKLPQNFKIVQAPFLWHSVSEQTLFLQVINSYRLDLFHSPHPNMPYLYFGKFILTLHDLTMLKHKTGRASTYAYPLYFLKWLVFKISLSWSVKRAEKIVTVSEYVKKQIIETFGISSDKVVVIYNGVSDSIYKETNRDKNTKILEKFDIKKNFFFYVGNAYPHKNLENLILAFELFNKKQDYELVLAGKEDFFYKRLKKEYGKVSNIKFLGACTDEDLRTLYSTCESFVYPSISEGFGIQIIESLKCGAKLICSGNTVFPEIAGKFALYFDPLSISDISEKITRITEISKKEFFDLFDEAYLDKFSWNISAQKHYELYEKN